MTRALVAAAAVAGALLTAAPAHATYLCADVYLSKDGTSTTVCAPWGSPLPHVGCPVRTPDLLTVCEEFR